MHCAHRSVNAARCLARFGGWQTLLPVLEHMEALERLRVAEKRAAAGVPEVGDRAAMVAMPMLDQVRPFVFLRAFCRLFGFCCMGEGDGGREIIFLVA